MQNADDFIDFGVSCYSRDMDNIAFAMMNEKNRVPYTQHITSLMPKMGNTENTACSHIATYGGVVAIISAMNANLKNSELQMNACILISSLAANGVKGSSMCQAGGCDAIVAAMNRHLDQAGVRNNGCVALANLWATDTSNDELKVCTDHGVKAVAAAMLNFAANVAIQVICCRALLYFAICKKNDGNV